MSTVTSMQKVKIDDSSLLNTSNVGSLPLVTLNSFHSMEKYHNKRPDKKTYRSGAWYIGKFEGTQRIGWGQFNWSDGGYFDGNHVENKRHGDGKYTWSDGSTYVGSFQNDLRHGFGELVWHAGEAYTGQFYEDMKHGTGTYTWKDGASYSGNFRNNQKCGFGVLSLANGDTFEGIYENDQRCGPGIYTHKQDGSQDVGVWKGNSLQRLCSVTDGAFLFEHVSEHYINAGGNLSPQLKSANREFSSKPSTPLRDSSATLTVPPTFPYQQISEGIRHVTTQKGELEKMSKDFIYAASEGDALTVKQIVESGLININVCDKTGYFALLAASVNCHHKIINYLLDNGADINQTTEEGLTCLSACHILLYAEQNYIENIAENMPKDNLFNTVELEKKTGTVINRNERKMILSLYEDIYKPFSAKSQFRTERADTTRSSPRRKTSVKSSKSSSPTNSESPRSRRSSVDGDPYYNDENDTCGYDAWKLDFYQRSMDRVKEIDEINRTFKEIMLNPHKISSKHQNIENIDLCSIDARTEGWSRLSNALTIMSTNNPASEANKILATTAISVMGYAEECKSTPKHFGDKINKLVNAERRPHLLTTVELLLARGANPSVTSLPFPVLFFAVKSGESNAVNELLRCKADTSARLDHLKLCPLHIAAALPGNEGILITELLLKHGADPNAQDGFREDDITRGRTALHIACAREDNYRQAKTVASLLLSYGADPDLLCFGNAPLSLAISSGNDLIIETLMKYNANVSLKLTHGLGSILCVVASFQAERLRTPIKRMELVDKLIKAGADMLTPVILSNKLPPCTVMDYAYHVYYQDRRISCTPYHALSSLERECFNARKDMLERLATYFRAAILEKECQLESERTPSSASNDDDVATGKSEKPKTRREMRLNLIRNDDCGLGYLILKRAKNPMDKRRTTSDAFIVKKRYRYCNECGRSVAVRLAPCPRCKEIFYCSKNCKIKLWSSRHRDECAKATGIENPSIDLDDVSAENTKTLHPMTMMKRDSKKSLMNSNSRDKMSVTTTSRVRNDGGFLPKIR